MKKIVPILGLAFFLNIDAVSAHLFGTLPVTERDFVGCQQNGDDPKCVSAIKVGCSTFCSKPSNEDVAKACRALCEPLLGKDEVLVGWNKPEELSEESDD